MKTEQEVREKLEWVYRNKEFFESTEALTHPDYEFFRPEVVKAIIRDLEWVLES